MYVSRVHRAGCPLRRRRRRKDTLGALDGLAGVGEDCDPKASGRRPPSYAHESPQAEMP